MTTSMALANEYHVSKEGNDRNDGSASSPFKTIGVAAQVAQPGDVITVREGIYRERVNPPRGGTSDDRRIVYQAAPGERVVIKGSEKIGGWESVQNDTWKVVIPNGFFGDFNPYSDLIAGDWFDRRGRDHHTGAVYVNGHWLTEAAELRDVLNPVTKKPIWAYQAASGYLMNVASLRPGGASETVVAGNFSDQRGIQTVAGPVGNDAVGYIEHGDWVRYESLNFGAGTEEIEFRAATDTQGGVIEIRLDAPDGDLLGVTTVPNTGGWSAWEMFKAKIRKTSGTRSVYLVFQKGEAEMTRNPLWDPELETANPELWFAEVDKEDTTIWAQFSGIDPNKADVEINVRQSVFYPEKTGIDYITVRGFTMMQAATPWAPPTAEQIGLIGTHWSKGWIIEENDISYSTCVGITLGKHGDEFDNTSADTAVGYVKTIERAVERGWSKENIGHHIVRNNRISHCEQAGLVGSLGPIFSSITGNVIHDIHVRQLFSGAEMAGIKLHAPIDTLIANNHIYRTARGMWLDWMTQGTRVTGNLFHDNDVFEDLFIEVNHGPYVVDNNVLLSRRTLYDNSQGGAYLHNLFAGEIFRSAEFNRETPYHKAHSTEIVGLHDIQNGDNRFYNNLFIGGEGLVSYDDAILPVYMGGNAFLAGAAPSKHEQEPHVWPDFNPGIEIVRADGQGVSLRATLPRGLVEAETELVTTDDLGRAKIPNLPYKNYNKEFLRVDTDYFGDRRDETSPSVGPFERLGDGELSAVHPGGSGLRRLEVDLTD